MLIIYDAVGLLIYPVVYNIYSSISISGLHDIST